MPGHICEPVKRGIRHLTLAPLKLAKTPYQRFIERRQADRELREAQQQIADQMEEELAAFHEAIWSQWPEAAERVREQVRKERAHDEQPR